MALTAPSFNSPKSPVTSNDDQDGVSSLKLVDFFEHDKRPTFVIDLSLVKESNYFSSAVCYTNAALRDSPSLEARVNGVWKIYEEVDEETRAFQEWAIGDVDERLSQETVKSFATFTWMRIQLNSQYRIVSGSEVLETTRSNTRTRKPAVPQEAQENVAGVDWSGSGVDDWTRLETTGELTPIMKIARSIDWSQTSLGPMKYWDPDLRRVCNYLMADPMAAAVIWGDDWNMLYNEGFSLVAGKKHPDYFGAPFAEIFSELPDVSAMLKRIRETRQAVRVDDTIFFLHRHGFLEETYFSFTLIPIVVNDYVLGVYNCCFEQTRQHIAERRMATLIKISTLTSGVKDLKSFWPQIIKSFQVNEHDIPFASMYVVANVEEASETASEASIESGQFFSTHCFCEASFGLPEGHPSSAQEYNITRAHEGIAPYLREAAKTDTPSVWSTADDNSFATLFRDIVCQPFGELCRSVVICPIRPTTGTTENAPENVRAFIIIGLNPRRTYDNDYQVFIQLLSRLVATSMATTSLYEEEVKRSKSLAEKAALEQLKLEEELARRSQQVLRSEMKFTHFADNAPIGINVFDAVGNILYANDIWYDVTQFSRDDKTPMGWMNSFYMEEVEQAGDIWRTLLEEKRSVTFESRLKKPWTPPDTDNEENAQAYTWVLCSAYPEIGSDGSVEVIVGCFMNISQQKWIEGLQKRRMDEAIEARRLQDSFIDMTSHEMRNPLSAIVHCADGIINGLTPNPEKPLNHTYLSNEDIMSSLEAARTIIHCANHQKRIVDDILTLSKLDSGLLPVTPETVQYVNVVRETLRMFDSELRSAEIELQFEVESSIDELGVDLVSIDPSRMTQVLINLLTNAIKFTQSEPRRTVRVRLGASDVRPNASNSHVKFVAGRHPDRQDVTSNPEWGTGEVVYLLCAVEDTGRGLTEPEMDMLFRRFSQATPRTHVQYGGSGLGLFISRELTELQGGEIGVSSKSGQGSTFAFYIQSRKVAEMSPEGVPAKEVEAQITNYTSSRALEAQTIPAVLPRQHSTPASISTKKSASQLFPILIVEDNLVNRKVLSKQLRALGFLIEEANHGLEALEKLQNSNFWAGKEHGGSEIAIVLMDIEMPVMDGLTAMRRIRALQAAGTINGHVPTIAVTANARKEQIEAAMAAGMDAVVSKPFRIPELVARMESVREKVGHTRLRNGSLLGS